MLNILQVQHFYYVGLYGGLSEAARSPMPERRTRAALSKSMLQLEAAFGQPLFERQPFRFTPAGREFWDTISGFFERLERFLAGPQAAGSEVRIAGSEVALAYLSDVLTLLRGRDASARLKYRSGPQWEMHGWLREGAVDLLIAPRVHPLPPDLGCLALVTLPLVLLAPKRKRIASATELWKRPTLDETLIVSSPSESLVVNFAAGLHAMRREWRPSIDASSLRNVVNLVADGQGIGLVLAEPSLMQHPKVTVLPLLDFEPVQVMAFWRTPARPLEQLLIDILQQRAARNWPRAAKST